jgi:hypothetical protein
VDALGLGEPLEGLRVGAEAQGVEAVVGGEAAGEWSGVEEEEREREKERRLSSFCFFFFGRFFFFPFLIASGDLLYLYLMPLFSSQLR